MLNSAPLKSRPTEVDPKIARKLSNPTKRAVSNPVSVDQSWKASQIVSAIGANTKTPSSDTAGDSITANGRCEASALMSVSRRGRGCARGE